MKRKIIPILYLLITACVDPIKYAVPASDTQLVVDGVITDEAGPYTVRLTRTLPVDAYLQNQVEVTGAMVTIRSNAGEAELLKEVSPGVYQTATLQGKVGRIYSLEILVDKKTYRSDGEEMPPPGAIDNLRFEFTPYTKIEGGVQKNADRFNVFLDSKGAPGVSNYLRWRLTGTYKIETFPQLHMIGSISPTGTTVFVPDPLPCSGPPPAECICCKCWITDYNAPTVSDDQLISGSRFADVMIGIVPVTRRTFYDKYYIEAEQMSLTPAAFTYWKLVRAQTDGATSLFQPPLANIKSNLHCISNPEELLRGFFMAASVTRKSTFITKDDLPYRPAFIDTLTSSCLTAARTATTIKPSFWP